MLIDRKDAESFCEGLRQRGKQIVFTNGCFDILHAGHVRYLTTAKSFGDVLIVGLNTDESVRRLKGANRPINTQDDRAEVLLGLKAVDHVIFFGEQTAEALIAEVKPAVYVKGGDYTLETLPEAAIVQSYGGRVELINLVAGRSTTNIIGKILEVKS
ncbi:MAG: D-glycero-beta-D-manno-heptose 1-phosphate adenylyltransferase [Selenomonadaceae bacterium]|nr:D-glycero-beta-D-manno-heptose 1-phosphate adenylyltransferase [Selenomonadaceae bacterium]MBQ4494967.1 D-glycero-beta-D-manno-heptose 1-phosphate adenylyltransferase [Selenomonadaceae bacterium]